MQSQVSSLLSILSFLHPYLLDQYRNEVEKVGEKPALDGGVAASAATTAITVFDRITALVGNKDNWGLQSRDGLENLLKEVYAENLKTLKASQQLAQINAAPHNFFKPSFARLRDGRFAAFYASTDNPNDIIYGAGYTLEEALQNYNLQFKLRQEDTSRFPAAPTVDAEEVPPPPPPTKKKGGRK